MGVSENGLSQLAILKAREKEPEAWWISRPDFKISEAKWFSEFGLFAQELLAVLQQLSDHSDPADTRGGKVGFEPASGVPRVHLSESLKVRLTASLTKK